MIKIIGGASRGRSIKTQKGLAVRPILARTRKSLFDILTPLISGARFLDLFAGNGVVGLEALSRGAAFVVFADISSDSVKIIQENVAQLGYEALSLVLQRDVFTGLISAEYLGGQFNIIYMGPPYKDEYGNPVAFVTPTLNMLTKLNLLDNSGIIIAQHHKKEPIEYDAWKLLRVKNYGDTELSFFGK